MEKANVLVDAAWCASKVTNAGVVVGQPANEAGNLIDKVGNLITASDATSRADLASQAEWRRRGRSRRPRRGQNPGEATGPTAMDAGNGVAEPTPRRLPPPSLVAGARSGRNIFHSPAAQPWPGAVSFTPALWIPASRPDGAMLWALRRVVDIRWIAPLAHRHMRTSRGQGVDKSDAGAAAASCPQLFPGLRGRFPPGFQVQ